MSDTVIGIDPSAFMALYEESLQRRTGGTGDRYWKVKAGPTGKPIRNVIRIMRPHPNMIVTAPDGRQTLHPFVTQKLHFSLGPQTDTACPCLEPYGEPCPACEWVELLFAKSRSNPDPNQSQQLKDLAFQQRAKFNSVAQIVDMAHPEMGVQRFAFGPEVDKRLRGCFVDDAQQFRDISDPNTGRDIILMVQKKAGTDFNQYDEVRAKDTPSPLPDMDWLNSIVDLKAEEIYRPTSQQVHEALQGKRVQRASANGALPAATTPAPAALPAAAQAPTPAPAPPAPAPAPPAPAPAPRGPGRPPKAAAPTPAPVPAAASAPAPAPAPPAPPAAAAPVPPAVVRQPVRQPAPVVAAVEGDPLVTAKAEVLRLGAPVQFSTPHELTLADLPQLWLDVNNQRPVCYGRDTEPTDGACQGCRGIIPCMAVKMGLLAATA